MSKNKTGNYNKGKWKKPIVRVYKPRIYFGEKDRVEWHKDYESNPKGFSLEDLAEEQFNKGGIVKTKKKKKKTKKPRGVGAALKGYGRVSR